MFLCFFKQSCPLQPLKFVISCQKNAKFLLFKNVNDTGEVQIPYDHSAESKLKIMDLAVP